MSKSGQKKRGGGGSLHASSAASSQNAGVLSDEQVENVNIGKEALNSIEERRRRLEAERDKLLKDHDIEKNRQGV